MKLKVKMKLKCPKVALKVGDWFWCVLCVCLFVCSCLEPRATTRALLPESIPVVELSDTLSQYLGPAPASEEKGLYTVYTENYSSLK